MKIISWNVNGIVACRRKGFLRFLADTKPDIMCCQEIKTQCELNTPGYHQFWNPAQRPGYSGTLTLVRQLPLSWSTGFGNQQFDGEGRIITLEYKDYYIVNVYVPSIHPHNAPDRPDFRLEWDVELRRYIALGGVRKIRIGQKIAVPVWTISFCPGSCFLLSKTSNFIRTYWVLTIAQSLCCFFR